MSKPHRAGFKPERNHARERARVAPGNVQRSEVDHWRREVRAVSLADLASSAASLGWSPELIALLCEELHVTDDVEAMLGTRITDLPVLQYPRAVALAVLLRHNWRPDDLDDTVRALGLTVRRHE